MLWLTVALAGAAGAVARFLVDVWLVPRIIGRVGVGTTVVNVTGSFAAGIVAGALTTGAIGAELHTVVAGGFLGAYTTFSTAMIEVARRIQEREATRAVLYLVLPLVAAAAAAAGGWSLGSSAAA